MSPNLMPDDFDGGLPLHVWDKHRVKFNSREFPGHISTVLEFAATDCCVSGCICCLPPTRKVRILIKSPGMVQFLDFPACGHCVRNVILPFWWNEIARSVRSINVRPVCYPTDDLKHYRFSKRIKRVVACVIQEMALDFVVDGIHQHPYIMEGI